MSLQFIAGGSGSGKTRYLYEKVIKEYIKNQLEEDYMADRISLKEYTDPFTGNRGE